MIMEAFDVQVRVGAFPGKGARVYHAYLFADPSTHPRAVDEQAIFGIMILVEPHQTGLFRLPGASKSKAANPPQGK